MKTSHILGILAIILLAIPTIVKVIANCYGLVFHLDDYLWLMLAGTICAIGSVIDEDDNIDLITLRSNADEDRPE